MPRFHVPQALAAGQQLELPADVAHHINVLRMAPGDTLTLFSGDGGEYAAALTEVQKKKAWAEVKTLALGHVQEPVLNTRGEQAVQTTALSSFSRLAD